MYDSQGKGTLLYFHRDAMLVISMDVCYFHTIALEYGVALDSGRWNPSVVLDWEYFVDATDAIHIIITTSVLM